MATPPPRDPWRTIWQIATSDITLVVLLLSVATGVLITAWLPQAPSGDPRAYARWLSETQMRFGALTSMMRSMGLFTMTRSIGFRALLALLSGCLLLQLTERVAQLRQDEKVAERAGDQRDSSDIKHYLHLLTESLLAQVDRLFPVMVCAGAVLLMTGLLVKHLWGWQIEGLIIRSGERTPLPETDQWVALSDNGEVTHSPGLITFIEDHIPGVQVQASDDTGQPLLLQQTVGGESIDQVALPLTSDQYVATPEAQLIVRLIAQPGEPDTIHAQVYRSPPGRLVIETEVTGETTLTVDGTKLTFTRHPYMCLTTTFNPGRWPTGGGVILMLAGFLGSALWSGRRVWLREEGKAVDPALANAAGEGP